MPSTHAQPPALLKVQLAVEVWCVLFVILCMYVKLIFYLRELLSSGGAVAVSLVNMGCVMPVVACQVCCACDDAPPRRRC